MKQFLRKIILLILFVSVGLCITVAFNYFVVGNQYKYGYQASLVDKVDRLKCITEPKIILVGNSQLAFGIDSELIEKEIGMPVVNLGLHGGLGNAYHEEIAKLGIRKGDVVVVCPTSFSDNDSISDPVLAWTTYDNNSKLFPIFRVKDYPKMFAAYPTYLRKAVFLWLAGDGNTVPEGCYSRTAFNEYGDVAYKPLGESLGDDFFNTVDIAVPEINDICIDRLNRLNRYCNAQGAKMVVAGYPIAFGKYADFSKNDFDDFETKLSDKLDCVVISHYADYFYPYHYFYNTELHLNEEGTTVRTMQLINDIKKWQEESIQR